jgi:hypothetical protein
MCESRDYQGCDIFNTYFGARKDIFAGSGRKGIFSGCIKPTDQAQALTVPSILQSSSVLLIILWNTHVLHTDIVTFRPRKLTVAQIFKKVSDIYGILKLVTVSTTARHFTWNSSRNTSVLRNRNPSHSSYFYYNAAYMLNVSCLKQGLSVF